MWFLSRAFAANCVCKIPCLSTRWVQSFNTVHKLSSIEKKNLGSKIVWNTYHWKYRMSNSTLMYLLMAGSSLHMHPKINISFAGYDKDSYFQFRHKVLTYQCTYIENLTSKKYSMLGAFSGVCPWPEKSKPRFEPGAAEWKVPTLPLYHATPPHLRLVAIIF